MQLYMYTQNMWQRLECLVKDIKINVSDCNLSLATFIIMTVSIYCTVRLWFSILYHSTLTQYLKPPSLLLSCSCNPRLYLGLFTD